jgi:hypothetical protein
MPVQDYSALRRSCPNGGLRRCPSTMALRIVEKRLAKTRDDMTPLAVASIAFCQTRRDKSRP